MVIEQYSVFLVRLDPTIGREIKKTRPALIISPQEMNNFLGTVMIAPMTTKEKMFPMRVPVDFHKKSGWIALDQIKTVDKIRLIKKLGSIDSRTVLRVKAMIREMLVD